MDEHKVPTSKIFRYFGSIIQPKNIIDRINNEQLK